MSLMLEGEPKYPGNEGCTFGDPDGKFCANVGCYANTLRENLKDLGDTPERWERDQQITEEAREKGCTNV